MKTKLLYILIPAILSAGVFYVGWYKHGATSITSNAETSTTVDLTGHETATLPPDYSASFVDWFVFGSNKMYGFTDQEVHDKVPEGQVKILDLAGIATSTHVRVTLTSTLTTQDWYVTENELGRLLVSDGTKPMALTLSNAYKSWTRDISPYQPFANTLYVWDVMPDDRYNSDEYPLAFWLVYNTANADGFTQVLTLFKTESAGTLREMKTFEGRNGFAYIDFNSDTISVGESATADPQNGFLGHEKTHITIYSATTFKKISEKTISNVYWTDAWLKWNY